MPSIADQIDRTAERMEQSDIQRARYLLAHGGRIVKRGIYYRGGPTVLTIEGANGERMSLTEPTGGILTHDASAETAPHFVLGERITATAGPLAGRPGIVRSVQLVTPKYIPAYYRVFIELGNGGSVEGAEQVFSHMATQSTRCTYCEQRP